MQIGFGDQHGVGEGAVVVEDADDGAVGAVAGQSAVAGIAVMAGAVDFPDDSLSGEFACAGDPDEFVSEDSAEAHVTVAQLQIGFADSGLEDVYRDFVAAGIAEWCIRGEVHSGIKNDGAHGGVPGSGCRVW
jgi:hypothetical protein